MNDSYRKNITEYWLSVQFGGKYKWSTLEHNGVMFPPEYKHKNVPIIYDGIKIQLDTNNEEIAFLYAKYSDSDYANNTTFNKNFWKDWKIILGKDHKIKSLIGCDFSLMREYLENIREKLKDNKKEGCETNKKEDNEVNKYKTAFVDGKEQPVGNFRMEPPGIFMGRGKNPKLGKIKQRIYPEDITLNIGKSSTIPEPIYGHAWKEIINDRTVEWLASWKDTITGKVKYVWLGASSDFKAESDKSKFDLARKLKKRIRKIRENNEVNLHSDNEITRQIATALYFIDRLALRVGNEKGKDDADTVGVTSLRVEHVLLLDKGMISLDFLGKDSIRYQNKVKVDTIVYTNLEEFIKGKAKYDNLFDKISSCDMNKYLQEYMKDLTAKVFRTFNASLLFQKELNKITNKYEDKDIKKSIILDEFSKANAKVATVMNHQKNVAKGYKGQVDKINDNIKILRSQIKKAKASKTKNPSKIEDLELKLKLKQSKKDIKKQLKNISLETSKANYIDPRITVAFLKTHNISIEHVFSSALIQKFQWAFDVDIDYKF